jgi:hypothetical protein
VALAWQFRKYAARPDRRGQGTKERQSPANGVAAEVMGVVGMVRANARSYIADATQKQAPREDDFLSGEIDGSGTHRRYEYWKAEGVA